MYPYGMVLAILFLFWSGFSTTAKFRCSRDRWHDHWLN